MMNLKKTIYLIPVFILSIIVFSNQLSAQNINARATIDSTAIFIGEQTRIHLELVQNASQKVQFPVLQDSLIKGVEIVSTSKLDTIRLNDNRIQIKQEIIVTSFDSALYMIPGFKFIDGKDTIFSNTLGLKVITIPVDTTGMKIHDIKSVRKAPFVLMDFYWEFMIPLIILCIILWALYFYLHRNDDKTKNPFVKQEPLIPAHIRAKKALETIKAAKLWQNGREKEYFTQVTDVLRIYIQERFGINAMEMTSFEILTSMRGYNQVQSANASLKQILELADFVKFAKYKPQPEENELTMVNSILFVSQTEPVEPEKQEVAGEEQKQN